MKQLPPKTLTVLIDTREKDKTPFPKTIVWNDSQGNAHLIRVKEKAARLDAGDFQLEGYEGITAVERKKNSKELWQNLITKDRFRFHKALGRLRESTQYPVLFVQASLRELHSPTESCPDPALMMDRLITTCINAEIPVYFTPPVKSPTDTTHGEFILRVMLNAVMNSKRKDPKCASLPLASCLESAIQSPQNPSPPTTRSQQGNSAVPSPTLTTMPEASVWDSPYSDRVSASLP